MPPRRNQRRKKSTPRKKTWRALAETSEAAGGATIPLHWLTAVIALFLIPFCWVTTESFFLLLAQAAVDHAFWKTQAFWFFSLGTLLWLITFWGLPRPVTLYVLGHELTHMLTVWLFGGKVERFTVGKDGGHIITNKTNLWIALSPYFFPFYSMLLLLGYGALSFFAPDLEPYRPWLYGLLGFTWGFHLTFTIWMMTKEQPDFEEYGRFFSFVVIYLINLAVLSAFLIIASPQVTWGGFFHQWLDSASFLLRLIADLFG